MVLKLLKQLIHHSTRIHEYYAVVWTKVWALSILSPIFPQIVIFVKDFDKVVKNNVRAIFINNAPNDAALDPVQRRLDKITLLPQISPILPKFSPNLTPKQLQEK